MKINLVIELLCLAFVVLGVCLIKDNKLKRWRIIKKIDFKANFIAYIDKFQKLKQIQKIRNEKKDKEIYEAIAFLRNMTAIGKGSAVSADFIIQQLAIRKGLLQTTYVKMLSFLRLNKKEEAASIFYEKVGTPISKDFARLLIQWDEMDPNGLTEILLSHQKNIKEVRITNQRKRDELISDLIYFPVVMNVVLIFINFIYVAYFLDQQELLQLFV